jgi:PTS system glucitol/sorbitol-specific IIA component
MKYQAEITGWGADSMEFLNPDCNFIIIFNNNAPAELADISILHTISELKEDPAPGDTFRICNKEFKVTAVGWEALNTLRDLGHCTVSFNGKTEVDRPGMIELAGEPMKQEDFFVGGKIEIE